MSDIISSDTVIVGGGITGLYTCYKLKQLKGVNHTVSLFEATGRFGGRIETVEMGGFLAEYGPMRFEKLAQPLLMDLISELGLETKPFVPYTAANDPDSLFEITFDESGGKRSGSKLTTIELLKLGILRLLNASGGDMNNPNDPRHRAWWATLDEEYYSYVRNKASYNGKYLYEIGFWNALSLVLSHRAVNKIIHYGTFYHLIHFNPNAAEWVIFWLRGLHPDDELVGIKQGTESLVQELVRKLDSRPEPSVSLHLNHRLTALFSQPDGRVLLEFKTDNKTDNITDNKTDNITDNKTDNITDNKTDNITDNKTDNITDNKTDNITDNKTDNITDNKTDNITDNITDNNVVKVLAKHVVLALPRCPLMQLRPQLPEHIGEMVDSVIPIPLVKCFFVNENPWWNEFTPPQTRASSTPAREIHYTFRKDGNCKRGIVMVYCDPPSMRYWTPFVRQQEHLKAELNLDKRLVGGYLQYLRSSPDNTDVRKIEAEAELISCFGIRDWSREPFEAGCHIWKAGIRAEEAIKKLTAFSLPDSPLSNKNIHICGEAYSDFQGFIEGGLRTALQVIKQIT
ncbi:FAD-dependent oxidoreductase [Methanosarcina sp. DH1]|uniref:flavin monoamine oxidase family protein n=1 Tax=Methanosarcina sp. DH1 TaxID=2605695 RepID=UPI001E50C511